MRNFLRIAMIVAAMTAAPALAEDYQCIALDMPQADYFALGNVMLEGAPETPASFEASSDSCTAQYDWNESQSVAAREFALYASGFDLAMNLLAEDGVTAEQVDGLMRNIPKEVAERWTDEVEPLTDEDSEIMIDRLNVAGIEVSENRLLLLQFVATAALGMNAVEEVFAQ